MSSITKIINATKHKKYLALAILFEISFLLVVMGLHSFYLMPGIEASQEAITNMQETINQLPESELPELEQYLATNSGFMTAFNQLLKFILEFILSIFMVYLLFKTMAWHYTFKMVHPKIPFTTTLMKFPLITLLCTTITIILLIIFAKVNNEYTLTPKMLLALALLTLYYYSQTSYSLIPAQKTIRTAIKTNVIKTYLINLLILTVAIGLPILTIRIPWITILITLIITIPAIIFTRLNLIIASWEKSDI